MQYKPHLLLVLISLVSLPACTSVNPDTNLTAVINIEKLLGQSSAPLVFLLQHPGTVDLDLFITDPHDESTYFGNSPASRGSKLLKDSVCSMSDTTAIEIIEFPKPSQGRYRIGLDFPESCDNKIKEVPYLIVINEDGEQRSIQGQIELEHFILIVDEFEYRQDPQ